jgi:hypothetical protein
MIMIKNRIAMPITKGTKHPPPVTIAPIFLCRPLSVSGIPMDREILDLAAEIPRNRFQENPPEFIPSIPPSMPNINWTD